MGERYGVHSFYVERDLVYTIQLRLTALTDQAGELARIYNDYPMIPGPRRSLSTDLAIVDTAGNVALAAEFKYEPFPRRRDVLQNKLPVTDWSGIVNDTTRVRKYVDEQGACCGYAVLIDEGGYLARRDLSAYQHQHWNGSPAHDHPVDALIYRYPSTE